MEHREPCLSSSTTPRIEMKRALILFTGVFFLTMGHQAHGAAQQIMSCGFAPNGWELWTGAGVPGIPSTKCSFVRASYRVLIRTQGSDTEFPQHFRLQVRGKKLVCRSQIRRYDWITCTSRSRWVRFALIENPYGSEKRWVSRVVERAPDNCYWFSCVDFGKNAKQSRLEHLRLFG